MSELCEEPEAFLHDSLRVTFEHPIESTVSVSTTLVYCDPPCCGYGRYVAAVPCGEGLLAVSPVNVDELDDGPSDSPFLCRGAQPDAPECYPDCNRTFRSWTELEGTLDEERADGWDFYGPVQPRWVLNVTKTVR